MFSNIKNHLSDFVPSFKISSRYEDDKFKKMVSIVEQLPVVPETYFHEAGHSIAFKLLYSDTRTSISIILGEGGVTHVFNTNVFIEGPPSILGRQLSPRMRAIVTNGAGPLFSVIYSAGLTALGVRLKNPAIIMVAFLGLGNQLGYAIRGIFESRNEFGLGTNDFSELKDRGIHPIFPVLGMGFVLIKNATCFMSVAKASNK